jgi:hypothetical protein
MGPHLHDTWQVSELSALTKWLLVPEEHTCPRTSFRLAARASQHHDVDTRVYNEWNTAHDAALIALVHATHHGSSAFNMRAAQLASLAEQGTPAHNITQHNIT